MNQAFHLLSSPPLQSSRMTSLMRPELLIGLSWLVLFWPWLGGSGLLSFDAMDQFYPATAFAINALQDGQSPFWNPYLYAGYPAVSDPQAHTFSPILMGSMLLMGEPTPHKFSIAVLLHLLLGGIGFYRLVREYGVGRAPALVATIIFMAGGSVAGRMQHVGMVLAYAYFPWAMVWLRRLLNEPRFGSAILFGTVAGVMALHLNQVAFLFALVLVAYAIKEMIRLRTQRPLLRLFLVVVSGAVALAVIFPQVYASLLMLPESNRTGFDFPGAAQFALPVDNLATLLVPNFFDALSSDYWGHGDRTVSYLYASAVALVVLVGLGVWGGRFREPRTWFFAAVVLISMLFALGDSTPVFRLFYEIVPGVDMYRRPSDATFVMHATFAVLVAMLLDREFIRGRLPVMVRWLGAGVIMALLIGLVWTSIDFAASQNRVAQLLPRVVVAALMFTGAGSLVWLWTRRQRVGLGVAATMVAFVTADLVHFNMGTSVNIDSGEAHIGVYSGVAQEVDYLHKRLDLDASQGGPYRVEFTQAGSMWPNAAAVIRLPSTQGYNPLYLRRYDQFAGAQQGHSDPAKFNDLTPNYRSRTLDMLGMRYLVTATPIEQYDPTVTERDLSLIQRFGGLRVYENIDPLPRIQLLTRAYIANTEAAVIARLLAPDFDPATEVILERGFDGLAYQLLSSVDDGAGPRTVVMNEGYGQYEVISMENAMVTIRIQSDVDQILLLNDVYLRGWFAWVDDEPAPLMRANYTFRAVYVPAGEHRVRMAFKPFDPSTIAAVLGKL